jgi:very-long-chain ceramide synthase
MVLIRFCRSNMLRPLLKELGLRLGKAKHGSKWIIENNQRIDNFSDFSYRFLFRCVMTGLGMYEYWHSPDYWHQTRLLWDDYPNHVASNAVQILYLLQLAYHFEDLVSVLIEGKSTRKDYAEMIIHHVVTVLLLYGSALQNLTRIGVIVSTMHMITDVPKDFAKVAKTMEFKTIAHASLGIFVITWFVFRLYLYSCVYVYSAFAESDTLLENGMTPFSRYCFYALLSALIGLNVMWTFMIFKLVVKLVRKGEAEDPQLRKSMEEAVQIMSDDSETSDDTK